MIRSRIARPHGVTGTPSELTVPPIVAQLLVAASGALVLGVTAIAAAHAAMNKREVRSAAAWLGIVLLVPGLGAVLYALFGINRLRRRAVRVRATTLPARQRHETPTLSAEEHARALGEERAHLAEIARVLDATTRHRLVPGNAITVLCDGDEAYPAMLDAIERAERSVALCTYIFDNDRAGERFVRALVAARARGVEVRVLIDDAGARYSRPPVDRVLRAGGVRVARFLPLMLPTALQYANLRNHRKVLVVDGTIGFSGGMNIRGGCVLADRPTHPTHDVHFRVEGPVVTQLMEVFAEDWSFSARELLDGERWFPSVPSRGDLAARAIADGPDEDLDTMRWALLGAIAAARHSVRVVTPYFLPDEPLIAALNAAALRGISVDVVIPAHGNLRFVDWAMRGELWKVLAHGVRVFETPSPFDHSKLFVVDDAYSLVGSANWDPRSLRLNFELGLECYDPELARALHALVDAKLERATRLTAAELAALPYAVRLRNAFARLFAPYL